MQGTSLLRLAQLGAATLAGYYAGSAMERGRACGDAGLQSLPGLPVFATVSAATPYSDTAGTASRVSQIMKYGFPGLDNVRSLDDFVLSYDRRNRVPHWVFEHLTEEHVRRNDQVDRKKCEFTPDESIHPFFRSQNSDYLRSGFDRGHMAAAGNHKKTQKHVEQTFLLSNMAPQVGDGFNRHAWNNLERHVRKLTKVYDNVYCCTGPLYLPQREADGKSYVRYQVLGAGSVAVPTHFYKVVVGEARDGRLDMEAYVMPNRRIADGTPLESFQASVALLPSPRREADGESYVRYQVLGAGSVAVPTHFYKVVVGEARDGRLDMEAYVMPNRRIADGTPLESFQASVVLFPSPRREADGESYVRYQVLGAGSVAVPTHFYKVVVEEARDGRLDMEAYVMPNRRIADGTPLESFQASVALLPSPRREADGESYVRYQVLGAGSVAVPTHFYKVVVGEARDGRLDMEAYVMPNRRIADGTPLESFQASVALLPSPRREADGESYVRYQVLGAGSVAVPTHFYKVVVGEARDGRLDMEAYVMPNRRIADGTPLESFQASVALLPSPRREADGESYVRYQVLGAGSVAVPTHFYKVVVGEARDGRLDMEAYVMPNRRIADGTPLESFQASVALFPSPRREADGESYVRYQVLGAGSVAVPTHFYKVVVGEARDGRLDMEAYVMPNRRIADGTPLESFQASVALLPSPRREADGESYVRYQVLGAGSVAVPTHFYKVVVGEARDGRLDMEAYVMPNRRIADGTPLESFQASVALLPSPRREADGESYVRYQVLGAGSVAVPTHFYKVVVGEARDGRLDMEAYVMPNRRIADGTPLESFQASVVLFPSPRREADGESYVRYQVLGAGSVAVPTYFYKVVVGEARDGRLDMEAYVMPNRRIADGTPLESFQASVVLFPSPRREADGESYVRYQVLGAGSVAVPTHFYKVVVEEARDGRLDMEAYVMPNRRIADGTPLESFQASVALLPSPRREADGESYVRYQVLGAGSVAVPTHFYKVVVGEARDGRLDMEAYVMPNWRIADGTPLESFQASVVLFPSPRREADGESYVRYQVLGAGSVAVPTHFYKVVVGEARDGRLDMEAYVMPNRRIADGTPLESFQASVALLPSPRREADGESYVRYQVLGAGSVAVPTHFYKVVVGEARDGRLDMEAYVMPNRRIADGTPLESFQVPPETIEKAAGLLFFDKLQRSKLSKINGKKI